MSGAGPRLLFLNPVGTIGGAERVLLDVLTGLRTGLPEASLTLLCGGEGPLLAAARDLGVSARAVPLPAAAARLGDSPDVPGDPARGGRIHGRVARVARFAAAGPAVTRAVLGWRAALRAERPDLIHSNGLKAHLLTAAALAGRRADRRPPVVWAVHDFYSERPLVGRMLRRAGRGVAALACVSAAVERDVLTLLPNAATRVILNGVDLTRFAPGHGNPAALDAAAGLPPAPAGTLRVGLAATYAHWKGQDALIEAAARLRSRRPELSVRWFVVGGPIYATAAQWTRGELETLAERAGVTDAVGFVPFQTDMPAVYRGLDVAVHASVRREPFGLTIAEAMACGRPTIVAAAGGAAELFTDGEDALGHPPGDAVALAVAVERLADDPARRARLGAAARRTAERRFDRDRVGSQYLALLADLLGAHATHGRGGNGR